MRVLRRTDETIPHPTPADRRRLVRVAILSALGLYVELLLIRWFDAQVRPLAYAKNLVLVASFLGLGIGYALSRSRRDLSAGAVALLALTLSFGTWFAFPVTVVSGPAGPEANLGVAPAAGAADLAAFYVLIGAVFALVTGTMVSFGRVAGAAMADLPALTAYTANVAGALAGILLFIVMAALSLPPWAGAGAVFAGALPFVRRSRGSRLFAVLCATGAIAGMVAADHRPGRETLWSPYNKVEVSRISPAHTGRLDVPSAWEIRVQNLYYQHVFDLRDETLRTMEEIYPVTRSAALAYNYPYTWMRPQRVLVLGAGTGNDVAAALRHGAREVVAVEIDRRILDLGRRLHPERPYDDPRVRIVIDDARAVLKRGGDPFDLIVFGLLDAHSGLFSTLASNLRLDNYVYTVEAMREALRRLAPDGAICIAFYAEHPWVADRLEETLRVATGAPPITAPQLGDAQIFMAGPGVPPLGKHPEMRAGAAAADPAGPPRRAATDDWPYIYLRDRIVPPATAAASLGVAVLAALLVLLFFRGRVGFDRHLFFLGAGFLLVETRTISQLGLLFGATWRVSAITIGAVLALVLLANLMSGRLVPRSRTPLYLALGTILLANAAVPPGAAIAGGLPGRAAMTVFLLAPLFVAALLFASSIRGRVDLAPALACNLLGSVLGGLLESLSMVFGIAALSLVALGLYAASYRR
jgi:SAM-dependent methyltransferase